MWWPVANHVTGQKVITIGWNGILSKNFLMRIENKQSLNGLDLKRNKNFSHMGEEKTRFIENDFYCIFKGRLSLLH